MKKLILPTLLLCAISVAVMFSCNKDYNPNNTINVTQQSSLNQVFSALRPVPQNITVTAGNDTKVYGANGTMLHFYNNSFRDASGNTITSGNVNIQLVEMYKPGDMIANRAPTMASDGSLLQSNGEVYISATMNGQEIFANTYEIGFKRSGADSTPMQLYIGNTKNTDSVATWAISDTTKSGTSTHGSTSSYDTTTNTTNFFDILIAYDTFNYKNSDRLYSTTAPNTTVTVVVPDSSYNLSNTQLYMIFPTINSVTQNRIREYTSSTHSFMFGDDGSQIPTGMSYELVVITNKNGNYYYCETSGTTTMGMTVNAVMVSKTSGKIKTLLKLYNKINLFT